MNEAVPVSASIGKPFKSPVTLAARTPEERHQDAVKAWDTRGRTNQARDSPLGRAQQRLADATATLERVTAQIDRETTAAGTLTGEAAPPTSMGELEGDERYRDARDARDRAQREVQRLTREAKRAKR
jgi:hypothetical protein